MVRTQIDGLLQRCQRVGNDLRALVLGLPHQLHGEDSGAGPLQEVLRVVLLPAAACAAQELAQSVAGLLISPGLR